MNAVYKVVIFINALFFAEKIFFDKRFALFRTGILILTVGNIKLFLNIVEKPLVKI